MAHSADDPWCEVCGIDSDGPSIKLRLAEILQRGERIPAAERWEFYVDLCRDGMASTAGVAAIPMLLGSDCPSPRVAWEMASTAAHILTTCEPAYGREMPVAFASNLAPELRQLARRKLLQSAMDADIGPAELVDSLALVLSLMGREDLSNDIRPIAQRAYGVSL